MRDWLNTDASHQTVMKELGLASLVGKDLKSHPNYKRFREFLSKREDKRMKAMIDDAVSTASVWKRFHLEQLPETKRKTSKAFKYYVRYAKMYDNEIFRNEWYSFYSRPVVYYGGTPKEMFVKVGIWAEAKRPNDYVKACLELEYASKKTLEANPYYKQFLSLQNKK
ncbi:Avirulence (Avh) protein [Phytophthora megakarya]|uniref:Avirulence (Avh) protein n=1 Tax=Phytophthora megakarya TaxID=4795 RepID=A0A225UNC5_9STRA|nr:Avirulence (Avh) protein [Phytophthora megakarya]